MSEKDAAILAVQSSPESKSFNVSETSVEDVDLQMTMFGQTVALVRKHMLVFKRSWWWTFFRSSLLPVAFIVFMSYSKAFYSPYANYGVSDPTPVRQLRDVVSERKIIYYSRDPLGVTDEMRRIMNTALEGIPSSQILELEHENDMFQVCSQNLRGDSACYGGVQWNHIDEEQKIYNYTIRGNSGLILTDIGGHKSDPDIFILPLQWQMDKAITGETTVPYTLAYTDESQTQHEQNVISKFLQIVIDWLAPALFLGMIGVIYHLAGMAAQEREYGISGLLTAMGVKQFTRHLAYLISFSIVYLPGWISIALTLNLVLMKPTNVAIYIFYHIFSGMSMITWAMFLSMFFSYAQLAGIVASGLSCFLAIMSTVQTRVPNNEGRFRDAAVYVLSFLFPPMNYPYFIQTTGRWKKEDIGTNMVENAPDSNIKVIVIFFGAIFSIFFYLFLAMIVERFMHGVHSKINIDESQKDRVLLEDVTKTYKIRSRWTGRVKNTVTAVDHLNLPVHNGQIVCLLGANGSGKTTTLEMISNIQKPSSGTITFSPGSRVGICPQKNVIWDTLTCEEHLRIWTQLKGVPKKEIPAAIEFLIDKCDLSRKRHDRAGTMSGGQKRKLQLAIAFAGGTNVCAIDEVSSGLDPLSRRKIWEIITSSRGSHTMLLTTHFLDEADILGDNIAIMSKGTLQVYGTTVQLKEQLGGGYRIFISHPGSGREEIVELESAAQVAEQIEDLEDKGVEYRVAGPQLEDVFLRVAERDHIEHAEITEMCEGGLKKGSSTGLLHQTWSMLVKRLIILKRNPLAHIVMFILPIIVAGATSQFLRSFKGSSCEGDSRFRRQVYNTYRLGVDPLDMPVGPQSVLMDSTQGVRTFIGGMLRGMGNSTIQSMIMAKMNNGTHYTDTQSSFEAYLNANYTQVYPGGVYLDSSAPIAAYLTNTGHGTYFSVMMMNLLTNVRQNGDYKIYADFSPFQIPWSSSTGDTLQFIVYFGLTMSVVPAFAALYPTFERLSRVRAMHYSNGLRVVPLWTAYAIFDWVPLMLTGAACTGIIGGSSEYVMGAGYLFVVFMLYALAASLFSFVVSLMVKSQLAAFAITAGYNAIYFLIYMIGYMSTLMYEDPWKVDSTVRAIHFTISIFSPTCQLVRAFFVAMNLFGVLCRSDNSEISYMGDILAYGGPILYLIVQAAVFYGILVWWDSGRFRFVFRGKHRDQDEETKSPTPSDVQKEAEHVDSNPESWNQGLRLSHVSKKYGGNRVVDDVTYGVQPNECFALLGPNGAGKTTTFNMIRGEENPSSGGIHVTGIPVSSNRAQARQHLGVCPQFDAMDKLSVTETLQFYAMLRGLSKEDRDHNVEHIIGATGLDRFRKTTANALSGGNKRKLSLAVALMADPQVLLLDEPSSGMDAFAKRIMWRTLSSVAHGRSIVLTTHSMEEADALANRAGILAKRFLAIGSAAELRNQYGNLFHVHLVCSNAPYTSDEQMWNIAEWTREVFPQSQMEEKMYHGQIKLAVPCKTAGHENKMSTIFAMLEKNKERLGIEYYSVSPTSLEEVFLDIVRKDFVGEDE
ncbi:ABC transporterve, putative [Yarrowia lipolytica]|nr:ABC transporterve, putative [Yarrowia lipolytica]